MKILVANLGSTSFKYRLFDADGNVQLARGGIERIGSPESKCFAEIGEKRQEKMLRVSDHVEAVRQCLAQLTDAEIGCLKHPGELSAIAFKTVHGGRLSGVRFVDGELLSAMEEVAAAAPAHNPPYIKAMRLMAEKLPEIPLVAVFETDFHQTIPERNRHYAVPYDWSEKYGIKRYGFHGASHRYIAERTAQLLGRKNLRIISCHLGGSSSLCAIKDGQSLATSMGFSPQSGLPQNNRVGDFDAFALPSLIKHTSKSLEEVLDMLASQAGLLGLSGVGSDLRDIIQAAESGNARAKLALDVFAASVRHYLGAYMVELGGVDAIVFTGGIGENRASIRTAVLENLESFGIVLDAKINSTAKGEAKVSADASRVQVWVMPTNEELIVARQAAEFLMLLG
jgi:acetate kinase